MNVLDTLLIALAFRVIFGVASAMLATPARWVPAGFFRVYLWVLLGISSLASVVSFSSHVEESAVTSGRLVAFLALILAVLSYAGSVAWLYEKSKVGKGLLALQVLITLFAGGYVEACTASTRWGAALRIVHMASSGALLGWLLTAMLLGHYYLNWPGMQLDPLRRLLAGVLVTVGVRACVAATGLIFFPMDWNRTSAILWGLLALRWMAGIGGPLVTARMAQLCLRIPNTQSATGILYAGVVLTLLGELVGELLATR